MFNNMLKSIKGCDNIVNFKKLSKVHLSEEVLYDKNLEWLLSLKAHGYHVSDTETDSDNYEEFDRIHEQYKPPPLSLEDIQKNLVVVTPRIPENVWIKRLEAQLEEAKHISIVKNPIFPPVCNQPSVHIPIVDNKTLEVAESSSSNIPSNTIKNENAISNLKQIVDFESCGSTSKIQNSSKKKKKKKNKKKRNTNESPSYQEQHFKKCDCELENVHFENTFPEMHSKGAGVIFASTNYEVNEVEIDKRKNETDFPPLDFKSVIKENPRSIKIEEIAKGNEQDQSIGNGIVSSSNQNQVIEVNSENNRSNQKKKKNKFIPLLLTDEKFSSAVDCAILNKQSNSNKMQNSPNKGKKKKSKVHKSSKILGETFSNFTSKVEIPRDAQIPSNDNKARDAKNKETETSERHIPYRNANERVIGTSNFNIFNNLNLWSLSELTGNETENRYISFLDPDSYETVIRADDEFNTVEKSVIVSDVKKNIEGKKEAVTPKQIETDVQNDHELPTQISNSVTLEEIHKRNLEYENIETKEIAPSTSTIILSGKKKKKNRKRTKHMQENTVSGCTGFNTSSSILKVYEDKKPEVAYEENIGCFSESDTIKDAILEINCFSGGVSGEKTSRRHKKKKKRNGTDVFNKIETNGDTSIVSCYDGLACYIPDNLLIDSDSLFKNTSYNFSGYQEVGNYFKSYTCEQEKLHDVRSRKSILFQTYEYNTDYQLNKMVKFELTEGSNENGCLIKSNHFLNNIPDENTKNQSETVTEKNETQCLHYLIDNSETNSVRFREKDIQIVLKPDQSESKNKPFLRSQSEVSKVPSLFTTIIHLIFGFVFLDLVLSFINWVLDHLVSITLLLMYIILNIFSGIFNFGWNSRKWV